MPDTPYLSQQTLYTIGHARELALFGNTEEPPDTIDDVLELWQRGLMSDRELAAQVQQTFSPVFEGIGLGTLTESSADEIVSTIRICQRIAS
jgi:hypothetical protein